MADADYVLFYSNRAYGSVARLPGEFRRVRRSTACCSRAIWAINWNGHSPHTLRWPASICGTIHTGRAGLATPPIAPGGNVGQPDGVVINLGYADENVIGYDHPQVLIFRNVEQLTERQIRENINTAAESAASTKAPLMLSPSALEAQRSGGTWSELFNRDGWANRVPWLSWLLVIELICLVALPFTWWLMRPLPDRGILFARVLGLLLVAWVAWWLVNAGVMRFSVGTVWVAMFVVAIPSAVVLWRHWRLMLDWLREKWRLVLTAERCSCWPISRSY